MARWLLPVPNSLLTFGSPLSQGAAAFDPRFQARAAGWGHTRPRSMGTSVPACPGPAMGDCSPSRPISDLLPLLHGPAKELSHRCWHCSPFSVTVGFSAIVSPHKGAAFRAGHGGSRGRACASESSLLGLAAPGTAAGKARRGAGRKEGFSAFCGLFLCYFCSPGQLLLPTVMILGPYSYLCFCPEAFVGDALGVKPARHSTRAMYRAINNYLWGYLSARKSSLSEHWQQVVCVKGFTNAQQMPPSWGKQESIPTDPRGDPRGMSSIPKAGQDKVVPQPWAGVPWAPLSTSTLLSVCNG